MKPLERFFHGEHGAARSYLLAKVFLFLLALDTWMLMIGHAGRYGVDGFNVAHFAWLDAILPLPTAGLYIGVLLATGLLALVVMLTGIRKRTALPLFLLYTLSWSMSMLDSYQHHYLVSVVLLSLAFFPQQRASDLHPLPRALPDDKKKGAKGLELERAAAEEQKGFWYAAALLAVGGLYAFVASRGHPWAAFFLLGGGSFVATFVYQPARRAPLLVSGFGFNLLAASTSIVYAYTAIAKLDENWLAGHTIRRISSVERVYAGLAELAGRFGIEAERFWSLFATAVIPQELFVAVAYLVAAQQDRLQGTLPRLICALGFLLALVLHVGAEAMGLEIGWFSYYMLLFAVAYLLPLPAVDRLVTLLTWPARAVQRRLEGSTRQAPSVGAVLLSALAVAGVLCVIGALIDLPGALATCALSGLVLIGVALASRSDERRSDPRPHLLATVLAAVMMWIAIAQSPVRWDFYRYLGGDLARRGELRPALEAYRRGERYAPAGESRADKIEQIEKRLAAGE